MKRSVLLIFAVAAAFLGGYWFARLAVPPAPASSRKILYYQDPMHPAYKSDKPGIAPDCGMKLVPVYADAKPPGAMSSLPPGTVEISSEKQQLIGVRYGQAEFTQGAQTIRAQGKVAMDETRVSHVHSRTEGWLEKVYVNFTGDLVRKGQPLLTIYSPELLAAQQEYLLALQAKDILHHSTMRDVALNNDALLEATRKRLELLDLSPSQIDQLRRTGNPVANITLYAPSAGYVISRNAFPNQKIVPDTDLYTLVDLSRIWVLASVFEYELPQVRLGQAATISLPYSGGRTFHARVSYIQPQVDPATRTVSVRLALDNPGLALKPDMFVDVELAVAQPSRLTVPSAAVFDSGLTKTVFVDRGNGLFEPREVSTGEKAGDRIEILKGLEPGERIVTSANFLLGSESQMKSAAEGRPHD